MTKLILLGLALLSFNVFAEDILKGMEEVTIENPTYDGLPFANESAVCLFKGYSGQQVLEIRKIPNGSPCAFIHYHERSFQKEKSCGGFEAILKVKCYK